MVSITEKLTKNYIRDTVSQGGHEDRIIALYKMIYEAAKKEFSEDNKPTLDLFLRECFESSMKQTMTREELLKILIQQIILIKEPKEIGVIFARRDELNQFRSDLQVKYNEVPPYLAPVLQILNQSQIKFINCTIRLLHGTDSNCVRGLRLNKIYYSGLLNINDVIYNLHPAVPTIDDLIEFN